MSAHCPYMSSSVKSRRIEVRIDEEERRLEEAAAATLGVSLSEFVRQSARGRAEEVLRERRDIALDDEVARRFLDALDADAPPPPEMRELFAREPLWRA
jgi:uncharacterized protein (DUF1778 family)